MIDGSREILDVNVSSSKTLSDLAQLILADRSEQVLTFSLKKVQINGRTFDVSAARIDYEEETQRPLILLSVSVPHHAQSRHIRAQPQNSR